MEYKYPKIDQKDNIFFFPLEQNTDNIYIFMLDKKMNDLIDWAQILSTSQELPPGVEFDFPEQQIQMILDSGEGQTIEFKSEITAFPLIQSIVAFANTNGGWILIGVDDQARVVGTDVKETRKKIEEWIYRQCDPPIDVSFKTYDWSNGKQILVIEVPTGSNPPYTHRENGVIYFRRGATDRAARRAELDAIYDRKTPPKSFGWQ